ncbi:hypothetical protein [Solicola sp. PLA-1-18]|uniref:hypothetical protein n=1 Tax=Solicola sp. PLA-1-18 TaxID=3380532 RepID=UPI003B82535C
MSDDGLVWHYTDGPGLVSILANDVLWATSAGFLNDQQEVGLGLGLLRRRLGEVAASGDPFYAELERRVRDATPRHGPSAGTFFILSASTHCDSLAMWRCYGGGGESYAIGLDASSPLRVLADEDHDLRGAVVRQREWDPVRYDPAAQRELVDAVLEGLPDATHDIEAWARSGTRPSLPSGAPEVGTPVGDLLDDMEQALLLIKHQGFLDEREARHSTVLYRRDDGPAPVGVVRYRATTYGIAPYVWLTGEGDGGGSVTTTRAPLPIRAVAISPSPNGDAAQDSLGDLLAASGHADVEVGRSRIPFRG